MVFLSLLLFLLNLCEVRAEFDCALISCDEFFPQATYFDRVKEIEPPLWQALTKEKKLLGYLFDSSDWSDVKGYSGHPMATMVGMDLQGTLVGAKVLSHSEPILLIGIPESEFLSFVNQFQGLKITDQVRLSHKKKGGEPSSSQSHDGIHTVDAISGATVTVLAENRTIRQSVRAVCESLGIVQKVNHRTGKLVTEFRELDWTEIRREDLLGHLLIDPELVNERGSEPWIEIYFGYLNLPIVGKNLVGDHYYKWLEERFAKGEQIFLIVGRGISSFKGSGFVRGGQFDRFHIKQGEKVYTFEDKDYDNFLDLALEGVPAFKEGGLFSIKDPSFTPFEPFEFQFLGSKIVGSVEREYFEFSAPFSIPERYLQRDSQFLGGTWKDIWKKAWLDLLLTILLLALVFAVSVKRDLLFRVKRVETVRYVILILALFYFGFYRKAQLSITQLLTLVQNLFHDFKMDVFLSEPVIFLIWTFTAVAALFWSRGLFCGWICPFGAWTEMLYRIRHRLFPKAKVEFSQKVHSNLVRVKYLIFLILLGVSFISMAWAERFSEIEPFKTAFLLGFRRDWPYLVYFLMVVFVCLFNYRFFCRYLCPLGAALAIPSRWSLSSLRRHGFCQKCRICAKGCESRAINERGEIDKMECFYCLECEQTYMDEARCPALISKRSSSAKKS